MKPLLRCLFVATLSFGTLPAPALDLTPADGFRDLEGFRIPVIFFADGADQVSYQPPANWKLSGGGEVLNLFAESDAEMRMQLRISVNPPHDPNAPEDADKWCRQFLPRDATEVILNGEAISPFTLRALPSREFTYSYVAQARRFTTSVAVVNLTANKRFVLIVTARPLNFKTAHEAATQSMFSFRWPD